MAFDINGLGKIGNMSRRGASPQKYNYRTTDTLATVTGNNYFSQIANMLEVGDQIEVQHVVSLTDTPVSITGYNTISIGAKIPGLILASSTTKIVMLTAKVADVSTASTTPLTVNVAGTIDSIVTVLGGTITTANANMTFNIGGVAISNSAIVVAAPGASGDVDSSAPTAAKTLAVGNVLNAITDGASTGTAPLYVIYKVTV